MTNPPITVKCCKCCECPPGTCQCDFSEIEQKISTLQQSLEQQISQLSEHITQEISIVNQRIDNLEHRINNFEIDYALLSRVQDLETQVQFLEDFVQLSEISTFWSTNTALSRIGVSVIFSGHTYNFWGVGSLDHAQSLANGTTYYIITSAQVPQLLWYQGEATIGTLWISTPAGVTYTLPIRFDRTGVYFTPNTQISLAHRQAYT